MKIDSSYLLFIRVASKLIIFKSRLGEITRKAVNIQID